MLGTYEYKIETISEGGIADAEALLNRYGSQGWRCIKIERGTYVFERQTLDEVPDESRPDNQSAADSVPSQD